jgi:hypothetical protein
MIFRQFLSIIGLVLLGSYQSANSAPFYTLETLGLYDDEHTAMDGAQFSYPGVPVGTIFNQAGQAIGLSQRFNGGSTDLGMSAWLYDGSSTMNIGLTGTEHTRADGFKASLGFTLNEAGQVLGGAARFNGSSAELGASAWLYDGSNTVTIGLIDAEHTRDDGYKYSVGFNLNQAGQVVGQSERYNGGSIALGLSAWFYDGVSTINIGLTNNEHTRDDGYKASYVGWMNAAGQVSGNSERYLGGSSLMGQSAWLYDDNGTLIIGPTDVEHTRNDGYRASSGGMLNATGQVVGAAERYNGGSVNLGQSAWLYDGSNTLIIGLTGAEHTRDDGYKYSYPYWPNNEAGQVIGWAERYNGGSIHLGSSAWLYDGSESINIGLTDAEHTGYDGFRHSNVFPDLNQNGQAIGEAQRYSDDGMLLGVSAWLYDGSSTFVVSPTGIEHTRADGYRHSFVNRLNEAGQVIGWAERYNGGSVQLGYSTWLYDGSTTVITAPTGIVHTRADGYQYSSPSRLNEAGQVNGNAERYNGGDTLLGQSAWFYDTATGKTYYHDFSIRQPDGYANSYAGYLGDDGLMLGMYELFDEADGSSLGYRAFAFTLADGFYDLGMQIEGGVASYDWDHLAAALIANDAGQILGDGKLECMTNGNAVYIASRADVIIVEIDIKPGSPQNSIRPDSSGLIAVAVLTTPAFNALQLDTDTVRFGPDGAMAHGKDQVKDIDGDGDKDRLLRFRIAETGIQCGDTKATLTGETKAGISISGTDSIRTIGCRRD